MLRLENQLWIYSPSTDRNIQNSGHMLRQSVMGSDLSYEDMLKQGEGTEFIINSVKFNQKIPEFIFTKVALKQWQLS
jgi:hypothetical protein